MSTYSKPDLNPQHSNLPTIIYILVAIALYGFGLFSMIDFFMQPETADILDELAVALGIAGLIAPFIFIFLAIYLLFSIVLAFILIKLMAKIAMELTIAVSIIFPILLIAAGGAIIAFVEDGIFLGGIFCVIGVLLLLLVLWKFRSLKRAGQFVEFSAQLVLDEKAILGMPFFNGIFTTISGFFIMAGMWEINHLFVTTTTQAGQTTSELSPVGTIVAIIFAYFYMIVYLGVSYILNAFVISYASDWYRKLDPDLNSAKKDVRDVLPIIIEFAIAMATVRLIVQILTAPARSGGRGTKIDSKNIGSAIFGMIFASLGFIIIRIIGAVWEFINYFTLISIVQNKTGLRDSVKDSARTTWESMLDVIIGETGYGLTMFIFMIVNVFIWLLTGFGVGFVIADAAGWDGIFVGFVFGIIFIILSFTPYSFVTSPMKIAFKTFMYSYAKDLRDGFKKPSRLPADLRDEFKGLADQSKKRRMRDPTRLF